MCEIENSGVARDFPHACQALTSDWAVYFALLCGFTSTLAKTDIRKVLCSNIESLTKVTANSEGVEIIFLSVT